MNKKIFWSFQAAYWSVYYIYTIFVVHYNTLVKAETNTFILISYLFILCFFGIPLSLIIRKIMHLKRFKSLSMIKILAIVTLTSLILANVWVWEIIILDRLYQEALDLFSITRYRIIPYKWRVYLWEMFWAMLLLFAWSAIYLFFNFWDEWNKQRFETEKANMQLELAQLKMLRSQISPHFLFNALSSLRALIRQNPSKAGQMLSKISDFLRYSLVHKSRIEVPFSEELQAAKNYISIEKVRFGDKLQVEYQIDPLAEDYPVPGFILHPIIENSVKYGMDSSALPLRILIKAAIKEHQLHIEVINSGRWKSHRETLSGTGTGLQNVKSRLQTLYPGRHHFKLKESDGFVKITLEINKDPEDENG